jgi:hypothetical protein
LAPLPLSPLALYHLLDIRKSHRTRRTFTASLRFLNGGFWYLDLISISLFKSVWMPRNDGEK